MMRHNLSQSTHVLSLCVISTKIQNMPEGGASQAAHDMDSALQQVAMCQ